MDQDVVKIAALAFIALMAGGGVVTLWGITRWISARTKRSLPPGQRSSNDEARLARIEMAVDAIAVEVERISESQRFAAKVMAERPPNQLPPGGS